MIRGMDDSYGGGFTNGAATVHTDTSANGGTTPFADQTDVITTTVTPVNDAPLTTIYLVR